MRKLLDMPFIPHKNSGFNICIYTRDEDLALEFENWHAAQVCIFDSSLPLKDVRNHFESMVKQFVEFKRAKKNGHTPT